MWIDALELRQYRNYGELSLVNLSAKNLFLGNNAAGKTNVLEAVYYLSHGKSPRTRSDRELIQWGQAFARLQLTARSQRHGGIISLEAQLVLSPENTLKTVFKLDGNPVKSRSEVVGKIPTVTFFLSDLLMLRGTPEDRRNALDSSLVQYDPVHFKRLAQYARIRQQKSQLLKQLPHGFDRSLLESLNQQLAESGAAVMHGRIQYLRLLESLARTRYQELAHGRETLTMAYQPVFEPVSEETGLPDLARQLERAMQSMAAEECRRGQVLIGPHRDDIGFFLDGRDACRFGSQGQQRSIVLANKLAEIDLLTEHWQGETPVLLLDDVMAELDPQRQNQLLSHIDPAMQVFLTTTHLDGELTPFLQGAASARLFYVESGRVDTGPIDPPAIQTAPDAVSWNNQTLPLENPAVEPPREALRPIE